MKIQFNYWKPKNSTITRLYAKDEFANDVGYIQYSLTESRVGVNDYQWLVNNLQFSNPILEKVKFLAEQSGYSFDVFCKKFTTNLKAIDWKGRNIKHNPEFLEI